AFVPDGTYTATLTFSDAAGNPGTAPSVQVVIDNTAPTVALSGPAAGAIVRQTISLQATAADTNLDHVEFFLDGADIGPGTFANGAWSVSVDTTALADGSHTWAATDLDLAGNTTSTATRSFVIDNTAPTVSP